MIVLHAVTSYNGFNILLSLQWGVLVNTFENKDSCITDPKWCFNLSYKLTRKPARTQ